MSSTIKTRVVSITPVSREDYTGFIAGNLQKLQTSFVLIDQNLGKVIVKNDSDADLKFKAARPGTVVPIGTVDYEGSVYRIYMVSPELRQEA